MVRMLPAPCRWIDSSDGSYLHWNCKCIAIVKAENAGGWSTRIKWQGRHHAAKAGSRDQGKRWIERWLSYRRGLP